MTTKTRKAPKAPAAPAVPPVSLWRQVKALMESPEMEHSADRQEVSEAITLIKYTPDVMRDTGVVMTVHALLIRAAMKDVQESGCFDETLVTAVNLLHLHLAQDCRYDFNGKSWERRTP